MFTLPESHTYWGIRIYLTTGTGLWLTEVEDDFDLVRDHEKAKPFLTEGSAKRFIDKLYAKNPKLDGIEMRAEILKGDTKQ